MAIDHSSDGQRVRECLQSSSHQRYCIVLLHSWLTFDEHPEEGREVKIADEDDGRAEGRDAAFAPAVIPARGGIFAVAAVVGLEKKFNISYRFGQKGCPKLRELAPVVSAITQPTRHSLLPLSVNKARSGHGYSI